MGSTTIFTPSADAASPGGSPGRLIHVAVSSAWAAVVAGALWLNGSAAVTPTTAEYDVLIRGGLLLDGTGSPGRRADVGIRGDRVSAIGRLGSATAHTTLDASGLAVAPGFINMLSWSTESLLVDGGAHSTIRQGITT
jgi:N-acyl-D-amino-acid deacylase